MGDRLPALTEPVQRIHSLAAGYEGLQLPVAVLLDNVRSMYNVGAFFRAADGVGLEKLCLCGITAHPPKKAVTKTALGAEEVVTWEHDWDATRVALGFRNKGYEVAAIETSPTAIDLFQWQPKFPVCVAFGHEVEGLRPELLEIADTHVRIPMLGKKTSLNVATAAGVVLYELLRKWRLRSGFPRSEDWVFASIEKQDKQPYWPENLLRHRIRPAAERCGIRKRIDWHTFRHSYATLLKANGEDVKVVQESLRHANSRITLDVYTQAVAPAKRQAQSKIVKMILPSQKTSGKEVEV